MCSYTDGLIEAGETLTATNLRRLCCIVAPDPHATLCSAVMAALIDREVVQDDVALLVLRRQPED